MTAILKSNARSEVEGFRWVLIRRFVLGIVFMTFLIFSLLRYGSYVSHERAKEKERLAKDQDSVQSMREGKGIAWDRPACDFVCSTLDGDKAEI
ncbi:hypothetical protein CONLIGDRAFT_687713 [Coniochaeta ligniaria NRRL 30616]|uniref:Uncharacterized protein n=1 Tax=Coniochaeta ligniaria NRRL 30616 TaxID=1408157 RepID=A0A1J7I3R7_9PEZI|nr:hypothetical protein CONLIGDRAFT_687713 [Coniochaeta ligniaria NRRL 30616]